jgi:N-acetylmuramoyl-L-alanine amidase
LSLKNHKNTPMVSDFIQKNVTILRIMLIITSLLYYVSSTLRASDVKIILNNTSLSSPEWMQGSKEDLWLMQNLLKTGDRKKKVIKIVIDAGHGGHDSGAVGKNSYEKDIALKLALKVGDMIQSRYPDVEVIQTRTTDVFIPLFRRIQYANEQNADLFISIHCNFISNPKTRGTETFVMGLHRAGDNLEVAKRENASILLEQNYEANYDGYDPNSPEGHIMLSMYQNNYLDKSIEFAAAVEEQFGKLHISKSRGVKQAGFAVLRRASMPAVLVEAGFLSNDVEEAFLLSEDGQGVVSESVVRAFDKYYKINISKQNQIADNTTGANTKNGKNPDISDAKISSIKEAISSSMPKSNPQTVKSETNTVNTNIGVGEIQKFKVQIAALKSELADIDSAELRKIGSLTVKKQNDVNKYMVGDFVSRPSAEIAREKLKNLGYKGAFIVALNE